MGSHEVGGFNISITKIFVGIGEVLTHTTKTICKIKHRMVALTPLGMNVKYLSGGLIQEIG